MKIDSLSTVVIVIVLLALAAGVARAGDDDWVEPMKKVHARFTGQRGGRARCRTCPIAMSAGSA